MPFAAAQRLAARRRAQDGSSKMSKSAEADGSRLNLLDSPDTIVNKIKRAKTDAYIGLEFDNPERPEARNLLTIYSLVTGVSMARARNCTSPAPACARGFQSPVPGFGCVRPWSCCGWSF